jgi:hypothetical protein
MLQIATKYYEALINVSGGIPISTINIVSSFTGKELETSPSAKTTGCII